MMPKTTCQGHGFFSVEWKIKVLEEALGELRNSWQKGEAFKTCVVSAFKYIHCHLHDETSGVPFSLQEIKTQFNAFVKENLFKEELVTKEKIKEICSLQSAIEEANKEYHAHTEFDKDMEKFLGTWSQATANTSIPRGREIAEALKRFRQHNPQTLSRFSVIPSRKRNVNPCTPKDPADKDKEIQSYLGAIDSSTAIASRTSQLDSTAAVLSHELSVSRAPLAPPADSLSSFAWESISELPPVMLTSKHEKELQRTNAAMGVLKPANASKLEEGLEDVPEISDEVRNLALRRGFEIYEQMNLDKIAPNEATFTAAARLALAKEDGVLAFELVKKMAECNIPPRLRSYGPALSAFCKENDADMAYEVDDHMTMSGVQAEEEELRLLLKVSVEGFREEKVYSLLHRLRSSVRQVSRATAEIIEQWFKNEGAGKLGVGVWDREKIRDAAVAGGGGWHGQGWLGQGNWRVENAAIDKMGVCSGCKEKLVTIDIDPLETENFATSVAALACEREAKSFERFQEWLERNGPFDAIVDGANVGLYEDTSFNFSRLNAVANGLQKRSTSNKFPLIILHNRRAKGGPANNPKNKQLIEKWRKDGALYMTPTGSNDDWYWLYAAVRFKCLLVTNDEMRDHLFELLGNSFFPIWKERHQVRFSGSKRSLGFHMPPPYSIVIQESESGSWHIPIVGGDDIETPRDWLCVTRCQRFELGQYQSHVLQESESQERESQSYSQLSDIKHKHAQAANGENCGVEELEVSRSTYRNGTPSNSSNKSFSSRARRTDSTKQGSFPSSPGQALHPRKMREKQKLSP
ncbi:hypothetical protein KI387_007870 [Taxus chinensis]|uniref:ribonuclease P n=1 Tax=Taxus chinensis TaxID=29808 RepID=A0AA38GT71_TAXCH|nr:hypothetical protein KI387_007870 [Taxus chinensis]